VVLGHEIMKSWKVWVVCGGLVACASQAKQQADAREQKAVLEAPKPAERAFTVQDLVFEVNEPFAPFAGTVEQQLQRLNWVLRHSDAVSPMYLYVAAATAYRHQRLEDAGFLFYAAQVRRKWELLQFPPKGTGGDSPAIFFAFLNQNAGQILNPAVMSEPVVFRRTFDRLMRWRPRTPAGYDPQYEYTAADSAQAAKEFEKLRTEYMTDMAQQATRLELPEYVKCFRVVLHHNVEENSPISEESYEYAASRLQTFQDTDVTQLSAIPGPSCDESIIPPDWRPQVKFHIPGEQIELRAH
jgi:hypothetical protein